MLGQNFLEIELLPGTAESMIYDEETGITTIKGNPGFQYEGATMYCDSALFNERKNTLSAYGNVHLNKRDTLNLYCDSLFYNGKSKKATLWGNVRVMDNKYRLTTDTLHFDFTKNVAYYHFGGKLENITEQEILTSQIAYLYADSKYFVFGRRVHYKNHELEMETDTLKFSHYQSKANFLGATHIQTQDAKMYCESGWFNTNSQEGELMKNASITRDKEYIKGDTLYYNPIEQYYIAKGNVLIIDSLKQLHLQSHYAFSSDSLNYSYLTKSPIATKFFEKDTLQIKADTLSFSQKDSNEILTAYRNVKIYSPKSQAISDSLSFNHKKNNIQLFHSPVMWSENSEMKGENIIIYLNDSTIKKAIVNNNSSIILPVDKSRDSIFNQIAGNNITAFFSNGALTNTTVKGNAITLFYPTEEKENDSTIVFERKGMNRLYASQLSIYIDSNEISGVSYTGQPKGKFFPMKQLENKDKFIPGFSYKAALRPKRNIFILPNRKK